MLSIKKAVDESHAWVSFTPEELDDRVTVVSMDSVIMTYLSGEKIEGVWKSSPYVYISKTYPVVLTDTQEYCSISVLDKVCQDLIEVMDVTNNVIERSKECIQKNIWLSNKGLLMFNDTKLLNCATQRLYKVFRVCSTITGDLTKVLDYLIVCYSTRENVWKTYGVFNVRSTVALEFNSSKAFEVVEVMESTDKPFGITYMQDIVAEVR